jgi:hypothetical protein
VACGFIGREMLRAVRIAGCLRAGCEYPTRIHLPNFPKNEKKWRGEYHYTRIQHNDSFSRAMSIQLNYNRKMLIQLNRHYIASYMFVEIPKLSTSKEAMPIVYSFRISLLVL